MEQLKINFLNHLASQIQNFVIKKKKISSLEELSKIFSINITEADLIILLIHPVKNIRNKILRLVKILNFSRFSSMKLKNKIYLVLNEDEISNMCQYLISFLISIKYNVYIYAKREIISHFDIYKKYLVNALIDENLALSLNAGQILFEVEPNEFPINDHIKIFSKLSNEKKKELFLTLRKRLENRKLNWDLREDAIYKLGALNYSKSLFILKNYLNDPDPQCRETLASILRNIRSIESVQILYHLLLDKKNSIRFQAAKSLMILLPGIYSNCTPQEILNKLKPLELIKIMKKNSIDTQLQRIWSRKGYNFEILNNFLFDSNETLIDNYLSKTNIASNRSELNSFFLLIMKRMPKIANDIIYFIQNKFEGNKKRIIEDLLSKIQNEFKIEKENGLAILL